MSVEDPWWSGQAHPAGSSRLAFLDGQAEEAGIVSQQGSTRARRSQPAAKKGPVQTRRDFPPPSRQTQYRRSRQDFMRPGSLLRKRRSVAGVLLPIASASSATAFDRGRGLSANRDTSISWIRTRRAAPPRFLFDHGGAEGIHGIATSTTGDAWIAATRLRIGTSSGRLLDPRQVRSRVARRRSRTSRRGYRRSGLWQRLSCVTAQPYASFLGRLPVNVGDPPTTVEQPRSWSAVDHHLANRGISGSGCAGGSSRRPPSTVSVVYIA